MLSVLEKEIFKEELGTIYLQTNGQPIKKYLAEIEKKLGHPLSSI